MASFFDGLPADGAEQPSTASRATASTGGASSASDGRRGGRPRRPRGAALPLPRRQGAAQGTSAPTRFFTAPRPKRSARRPTSGAPRLDGRRPAACRDASRDDGSLDEARSRLIDLRSLADPGQRRRPSISAPWRRRGASATGMPATAFARLRRSRRRCKHRRLPARLRGLRRRAFPAHRPGGDHARDRRRPRPARPAGAFPAGHVFLPRRLRRAGRDHRGCRPPRDAGGIGHQRSAASAITRASPGLSRPR